MTNLHYIEDESIGGIEREYGEVERKANVGDYVIHNFKDGGGRFFTDNKLYEVICEDSNGEITLVDDDGFEHILSYHYYKTLEPTDIVRIDNVRYRLVDRRAEVGEKVIVSDKAKNYDGDYANGDIFEARNVDGQTADIIDIVGEIDGLYHYEYCVLDPVEAESMSELLTVDETQASPQVIDMLAHIAKELAKINRRLDTAEEHIGDTQRNVETFAQQTEANTEAIKKLESTSDLESGRVRKLDFEKDVLMADIGSLNKRLEAFINDAR